MHKFLNGRAGVGKNFLINALTEYTKKHENIPGKIQMSN